MDSRPAPGGPSAFLSVSDLTVRVGRSTVLDRVSFSAARGVTLAIVGPNGAGKTTLLRALLGRVPYTGRIEWGGPVRIGYVPQKLVDTDIPLSVAELLSLKCPGDYGASLAMVGLGPGTLDRQSGSRPGGEVQRVLIAWVTVDPPDVLLFDEPTANVGSEIRYVSEEC